MSFDDFARAWSKAHPHRAFGPLGEGFYFLAYLAALFSAALALPVALTFCASPPAARHVAWACECAAEYASTPDLDYGEAWDICASEAEAELATSAATEDCYADASAALEVGVVECVCRCETAAVRCVSGDLAEGGPS